MPAGFRRHLVGNTLRNVFRCDLAEIRFVGAASDRTDIFINQQIILILYLNNTINHRSLTPRIMSRYTHKMAVVLWGLGERCKLPQWGLGRSPSRNRIWCILALKSDTW